MTIRIGFGLSNNIKPVMKRFLFLMTCATVTVCIWLLNSCDFEKNIQQTSLEGKVDHEFEISTRSLYAQKLFNQGLIMAYRGNHTEAEIPFREAINQDDECALCYWGLAYALRSQTGSAEGQSLIQKALKFSKISTEKEKYLIRAMAAYHLIGFNDKADPAKKYALAMAEAYRAFPEDDDIVALYAESLNHAHFVEEEKLLSAEAKNMIKKAITLNPKNPLAAHLYLNSIEKANPKAEQNVTTGCASLLDEFSLYPGKLKDRSNRRYMRMFGSSN